MICCLQKLSDNHPNVVEVFNRSTPVSLWVERTVDIAAHNETFQIVIRGHRFYSYTGDAAIDDVQLTQGIC